MWKSTLYDTTKVTIELRELVENGVKLFDFEYPSYYKGAEKTAFEQKIIDHYYFRQIGQETVGRFLHYFRARMREIMPRYVDMYKTVELMHGLDNPFDNVDIVETFEQESTGASSGSSSGTTTGTGSTTSSTEASADHGETSRKTHVFSNTPQGDLTNLDTHMTEATVDEDTGSDHSSSESSANQQAHTSTTDEQTNTSSNTGTVKHTLTRKGNQGVNTYAHDIIEFRQSLIDVDMMVIKDLNDLFLGVY